MTRTQKKESEITDAFSRLHSELSAIIAEEFPRGTQVSWMHGTNWQHGIVEESAHYEWSNDVIVRNKKTDTTRRLRAKDLELGWQ